MFFPIRDSIASRRFALINWLLILVNAGLFFYELSLPPDQLEALVARWGVVPLAYRLGGEGVAQIVPRLPSLASAMFLHGGFAHLFGNMLFLWIFGDNIEDRLGHAGYLLFYLCCGVAASIVQVLADVNSGIPMIGASGAIGGVMGAYVIFFPRAQVLTMVILIIFVRFIWVPAIIYLGVWFVMQLIEAMAAGPGLGAGVAFWAHVGGFLTGLGWAALLLIFSGRRRAA